MKNRTTVKHGMLDDLIQYLKASGWEFESPIGEYEVLRARKSDYPRPLLIHERERGCGYSVDERDMRIYKGWQRNRHKRELPPCDESQKEFSERMRL